MRYTLMRCTPRCSPMKGTPMGCTTTRYMPVREARRERHSHKRDACLREMPFQPMPPMPIHDQGEVKLQNNIAFRINNDHRHFSP
jgi:hypothetical protein